MEDKDFLEEAPDIFTLSDDEGNEFTFEVLDEADVDGEHYAAMLPVYDDPADALDDSDPCLLYTSSSLLEVTTLFPASRHLFV